MRVPSQSRVVTYVGRHIQVSTMHVHTNSSTPLRQLGEALKLVGYTLAGSVLGALLITALL